MGASNIIVVGAGIGGLAAALDLSRRGASVTVLEKSGRPGGKMRRIDIQGQSIDSGPTVFTMPWIFEELFADAGLDLRERLSLHQSELLARHAWTDGSTLDLFIDIDRSAEAIRAMAGAAEADRYRRFCERARRTYETLYGTFMRRQRPSPFSLVAATGFRGLIELWNISPFRSLWRELGRAFEDPRLQGLFGRYATYCGGSPLHSPATLMLVAHVEQCGVWRVEGGMQRLAETLVAAIEEKGGTVRFDADVAEIETRDGRTSGVRLSNGEAIEADAVVTNADVAGIRQGTLGRRAAAAVPRHRDHRRSLSAVTWSVVAETSGFELAHHNVFFPEDYPREFTEIFDRHTLPSRPAVYVCRQDEPLIDPPGSASRLFLITNAPPAGDREAFDENAIGPVRNAVFELLESCGLRLAFDSDQAVVQTPRDFEHRFPGTGGALYGSAPHGWRASFTRPGARSRLPGLYFSGGSVHPGAGVPMTAISGRLAAAAVAEDLGLR